MAAPNPLNPINPNTAQTLLGKFAASDAKHDFATSFINIFKGKTYSNIGTTGTAPTDYFNEWETFYNVFRNNNRDREDSNYLFKGAGTDPGVKFKQTVLNTNADSIFTQGGLSNINLNTYLYANHTYKLRSKLFSTGSTVELSNSEALIQFLGGDNNDIYIQQDASFISFSDFFISAKNGAYVGVEKKNFYYLGSREGQNDAAGKTNSDSAVVTKTQDKKVSVSIKSDESNETIIYPKYTTDQNTDVKQNFQSIYNLSISPITTVKGVKMVSLNFYDKEAINATQKGKAENAKGNLKNRLNSFFKSFNTTSQNKHSYFTALQQKRSGDWLQVLSTYDLARYNISGRRGILITHDLICAAYAIAMGVDVVITIQYNGQKWLVYFQNERFLTQTTKAIIFDRYEGILANITKINSALVTNINSYTATYNGISTDPRGPLLSSFLNDINSITPDTFTINTGSDFSPKTVFDNTNTFIRTLLLAYFKYAIAYDFFPVPAIFINQYKIISPAINAFAGSMAPLLNNQTAATDEDRILLRKFEEITSKLYNLQETINTYKLESGGIQIIQLRGLLDKKFSTKSKDIRDLNDFLSSFSPFSVETPKTPESSKTFLNRFRFKNPANSEKKNDYGIFSLFLNKLPLEQKNNLFRSLNTCQTRFTEQVKGISTTERGYEKLMTFDTQFKLFINEISFYFLENEPAPTQEVGTVGELLSEINEIQRIPPDGAVEIFKATALGAAELIGINKPLEVVAGIASKSVGGRIQSGGNRNNDSFIQSTPFSIYLMVILQKRHDNYKALNGLVGRFINIIPSFGIYYFRTFLSSCISSIIGGYISPEITESIINFVLLSRTFTPEVTSLALSRFNNFEINEQSLDADIYSALSNDYYIRSISEFERAYLRVQQVKALNLRGLLKGGGNYDIIDLQYNGYGNLFFHMDTLRSQLNNIDTPEHGLDYQYLARYSQFLIAMEKSIDQTIKFFTVKRKVVKGGQQQTQTMVITEEEPISLQASSRVLRLTAGPENELYELPISYCTLFRSFGDYSDLILSNLLPRIFFDETWDEIKPLLIKAFVGSSDTSTSWIGVISEMCNDNFLNISVDRSLDTFFDPKDYFLRQFLIIICSNLQKMSSVDMSIESKTLLENELNQSIDRLLNKNKLVEKNILLYLYRKKATDSSITFENIDDLDFLIKKDLVNKGSVQNTNTSAPSGGRKISCKKQLKKRTYGKTKKHGRKMRLKSRRKS